LQAANAPPIQGLEAIRQFYVAMFQLPIVALTMGPTTVVVSETGDVAVNWGILTAVLNAKHGPVTDTLKFMAVWQRHDGQWKVVANSWSSNAPSPQ
jgi:ketosteroid isomerase-like protein